jgi:hypothetical protein
MAPAATHSCKLASEASITCGGGERKQSNAEQSSNIVQMIMPPRYFLSIPGWAKELLFQEMLFVSGLINPCWCYSTSEFILT